MFKTLILLTTATATLWAGDIRAHLTGSTLNVYVDSSTEQAPQIPGAKDCNYLLVSVATKDEAAQAVMVHVMVRLADGTRTTFTGVKSLTGPDAVLFRFALGATKATELVDIHVDNLHKSYADTLAPAF